MYVVADGFIERHDATRIHLQLFAGPELKLDEIATAVDEYAARSGKLFEDEAFTSQKAGAELFTRAIFSCTVD